MKAGFFFAIFEFIFWRFTIPYLSCIPDIFKYILGWSGSYCTLDSIVSGIVWLSLSIVCFGMFIYSVTNAVHTKIKEEKSKQ